MSSRSQIYNVRLQISLFFLLAIDAFLQVYFRGRGMGLENQGVSFGLFPGLSGPISIFVYFVFIFIFFRKKSVRENMAFWLLVAGGFGNTAPRLIWGSVWDYLHVSFLPFWFNLSDVTISAGVIWYTWKNIRQGGKDRGDYNSNNGNPDSLRGQ